MIDPFNKCDNTASSRLIVLGFALVILSAARTMVLPRGRTDTGSFWRWCLYRSISQPLILFNG